MRRMALEVILFFLLGIAVFTEFRATPVAGLAERNPLFEVLHNPPLIGIWFVNHIPSPLKE